MVFCSHCDLFSMYLLILLFATPQGCLNCLVNKKKLESFSLTEVIKKIALKPKGFLKR